VKMSSCGLPHEMGDLFMHGGEEEQEREFDVQIFVQTVTFVATKPEALAFGPFILEILQQFSGQMPVLSTEIMIEQRVYLAGAN
jgi:hypothetical protein